MGMNTLPMWDEIKKGWDSRLLGPILPLCYAMCVLSLSKGGSDVGLYFQPSTLRSIIKPRVVATTKAATDTAINPNIVIIFLPFFL